MTSTTTTATAGPMNAPDPSPDPAPPPPLPAAQRPLAGLLVLDFSQFLAGPSCALRLADMGARVVKIERPQGGDLGRRLYISNLEFEGDSTLFHSINRNKESFAADLKQSADRARVGRLVSPMPRSPATGRPVPGGTSRGRTCWRRHFPV